MALFSEELKGVFEGVAASAAVLAGVHFLGLVGLKFLPPGIEHGINSAVDATAGAVKGLLGFNAAPAIGGLENMALS